MIDLSLLNETTEILASNFTANEIEELGKLIHCDYNGHSTAGVKNHVTMSPRKGANALVQYTNFNKKTFELMKLLIEMDESSLNGKPITSEGLEAYLNKLEKTNSITTSKKGNHIIQINMPEI